MSKLRPPGAPYVFSDLCPGNGWLGWSGFMWSGDLSRKTPCKQPHNVSQASQQQTQFMIPALNPIVVEISKIFTGLKGYLTISFT